MKLTGAAILVPRGMKVLQAAPAAYPYRSAAEGARVAVVDQLLQLFAQSIIEKARALNTLDLTPNQRKRLRSSITFEIRTAGSLLYPEVLTPEMSEAAMREAERLGVDLYAHTWRSQSSFDRGRKVFHWEHVDPISCIQQACEGAADAEAVLALLKTRLRIAWILKREDRSLTQLGFRSNRPDPEGAYRAAKIVLFKRRSPDAEPAAAPEGDVPMTDIEKARHLFQEAGLAFPTIPMRLAAGLKEQGQWLFSTRELKMSPYNLQHYVHESDEAPEEYAVLSHSGHGANSYAVQYYLVYGPLRMFLHLRWGGVYMDADAAASEIRECFSLADQIVSTLTGGKLAACEPLTVVGSDFYGSHWSGPGQSREKETSDSKGPAEVLAEVLHRLKSPPPNQPLQQTGPA